MWLEILLAMATKAASVSGALLFFTMLFSVIALIAFWVASHEALSYSEATSPWEIRQKRGAEKIRDVAKLVSKWCFISSFFLAPIAALPSVNDLWKVRVGLIKLQLASPENIQKGADVIERLGKKLECKYLGCDDAKESK